ncbi:AsmA family protein [Ketobacter sp.]
MRIAKIIGILVAVVVSLVLIGVGVLLFVVDPNDYKSQISDLVYDASGYHLTLSGDLSWSFFPVLGFESEAVSLSTDSNQGAFVELQSISVGVQLIPLFSKQLKVDSLNLAGLNADLQVDEQGVPNWQPIGATSEVPAADEPEKKSSDETNAVLAELEIPLIQLSNSTIRYSDLQAGGRYVIEVELLQLENVRLNQPFAVTLKASADAGDGLAVTLDGKTQVTLDLDQSRYQLSAIEMALAVAGIADKPLPLQLQAEAVADLKADSLQLSVLQLKVADYAARLELQVSQLQNDPAINGRLQMAPSDLRPLLVQLGIELPEMASATALSKVGVDATLKGSPRAITVQPFTVTLDESKLTGLVALDDIEHQALRFDLLLDQIDLDHYLPPAQEGDAAAVPAPAKSSAPAAGEAELIPVELIRSLNLDGRLNITQLQIQNIPMQNVLVKVNAKSGVLKVSPISVETLGGKITGNVSVDAKNATPVLDTDLNIDGIEIASVAKQLSDLDLLSGRASFKLDTKAKGNDVDALLRDAVGKLKLQLDNGVIHGINLNNIVVDALRDQINDLKSFYPDYEKYLPRELKQDTDINAFLANATIEKGKLIMPQFNFAIDNGAIDASGNFDLIEQGFDYQLGVFLSAMDQVKYLKGTKWPVSCKGTLDSAPADWCRPDTKAIKKVLGSAAKSAFKDNSAKELGDKLGVDAESQDQLEAELKAKAKEEEDRAKKKLQDKLDKLFKKL